MARKYLNLIYDLCSDKITLIEFKEEVRLMGEKQLEFDFKKKKEVAND